MGQLGQSRAQLCTRLCSFVHKHWGGGHVCAQLCTQLCTFVHNNGASGWGMFAHSCAHNCAHLCATMGQGRHVCAQLCTQMYTFVHDHEAGGALLSTVVHTIVHKYANVCGGKQAEKIARCKLAHRQFAHVRVGAPPSRHNDVRKMSNCHLVRTSP